MGVMRRIERTEGRRLFGADPAAYELGRPGHAPRVYEVLVERCRLGPGTSVVEVGAGTGQATRKLLELGADPLVVVEPNPSLAAHLAEAHGDRLELVEAPLEEAELEPTAFDLAAAASSFHWVDEQVGLARLVAALRPGGWCAIWWTLFGDGGPPDPFIVATSPLLDGLDTSPTKGEEGRPRHALDRERRVAALVAAGFVDVEHELAKWETQWDSEGIRALYGSFSPILRLDEARRERILDEVARIASDEFGGRVTRGLTTSLYTARRPP
jgi:SAM-dependent methyltransferase